MSPASSDSQPFSPSVTGLSPVVRPPWPDELARLADAFPGLQWSTPLHLRVLAVPATAVSPERLVGLAAVAEPAPGAVEAVLFLRVRARFAATRATDFLLAEAIALARGLGASMLSTGRFAGPDPREAALLRAGFAGTADGRSWQVGVH